MNAACLLLAQMEFDPVEPVQQMSYLQWLFSSLGIKYTVLLPLCGLLVFIAVALALALCKRPAVIATLVVLLPLPLLLGVYASVDGMIAAWSVIATSVTTPKPAEWAAGVSMSLVSIQVGFWVNLPSYLLMAIGLPIRWALYREPDSVK